MIRNSPHNNYLMRTKSFGVAQWNILFLNTFVQMQPFWKATYNATDNGKNKISDLFDIACLLLSQRVLGIHEYMKIRWLLNLVRTFNTPRVIWTTPKFRLPHLLKSTQKTRARFRATWNDQVMMGLLSCLSSDLIKIRTSRINDFKMALWMHWYNILLTSFPN